MGIDYHALKFLKYACRRKAFGAVATIGRQGMYVPPWRVREVLGLTTPIDYGAYCERLLTEQFAASSVDSYDNSDYESATYIRDLNRALTPEKRYDTIIDAGCLEHVYNVAQALKNVSAMANPGAQILHILPANGLCGHGFWQFSPELFFSLYSESNGYRETEVFLADLADERSWYRVKKPRGGKRADVVCSKELYVIVRTCLIRPFCHDNVQQSDYAFAWQKATATATATAEAEGAASLPAAAQRPGRQPSSSACKMSVLSALSWVALLAYRKLCRLFRPKSLSVLNPYLTRVDISDSDFDRGFTEVAPAEA